MKKLLALLLCLTLVLSLAACGKKSAGGETDGKVAQGDVSDEVETDEPVSMTVSEFFDSITGKPELFFYGREGREPAKDEAPYAVYAIKDKQAMELPNVAERTYGDFDGLTDEEIIAMLREDVGTSYLYRQTVYGPHGHDDVVSLEIPTGDDFLRYRNFAYNIVTDDTGNAVEEQEVLLPKAFFIANHKINMTENGVVYRSNNEVGVVWRVSHDYGFYLDEDTLYYEHKNVLREDYSEPTVDAGDLVDTPSFGGNICYSLGEEGNTYTVYSTTWYEITPRLYSRTDFSDVAKEIRADFAKTAIDRNHARICIDEEFEEGSDLKGMELFWGMTSEEAAKLMEKAAVFEIEFRDDGGLGEYYKDGKLLES